MTTVDRSDIRGLVTARLGFVVELPLSDKREFDLRSYPTGSPRFLLTVVAPPETVLDKRSFSYRRSPMTGFTGCGPVSSNSLHSYWSLYFVGDRPHERTELSGNDRYNQLVGLAFCVKSFVAVT